MSVMQTVKRELKEVGLVTVYFLVCFGIMLLLKKLVLAEYEVEFYALSGVVVGALVAAKVVVILDKTRVGTRFDETHSVGVAAIYKTAWYAVATFFVLFAEKLFHAYRETGALGPAIVDVWEHRDRDVMFAKVIVIGIAYVGYHLYAGIDRRLGGGKLWRTIWS
jgi:hypothetical protein